MNLITQEDLDRALKEAGEVMLLASIHLDNYFLYLANAHKCWREAAEAEKNTGYGELLASMLPGASEKIYGRNRVREADKNKKKAVLYHESAEASRKSAAELLKELAAKLNAGLEMERSDEMYAFASLVYFLGEAGRQLDDPRNDRTVLRLSLPDAGGFYRQALAKRKEESNNR